MKNNITTITVKIKDKDKFKQLCIVYKVNQQELFSRMVRVMKHFKPELKEGLK